MNNQNASPIHNKGEIIVVETNKNVNVSPVLDHLHLPEDLIRGINMLGLKCPFTNQQRAERVYDGRLIDKEIRNPQVLYLSPSRELAVQVQMMASELGCFQNKQCYACIVVVPNLGEDIQNLNLGQHFVSGTPDCVFDMTRQKNLPTCSLKVLVLDEADEMLKKGLKEQIYDIYQFLLTTTQV